MEQIFKSLSSAYIFYSLLLVILSYTSEQSISGVKVAAINENKLLEKHHAVRLQSSDLFTSVKYEDRYKDTFRENFSRKNMSNYRDTNETSSVRLKPIEPMEMIREHYSKEENPALPGNIGNRIISKIRSGRKKILKDDNNNHDNLYDSGDDSTYKGEDNSQAIIEHKDEDPNESDYLSSMYSVSSMDSGKFVDEDFTVDAEGGPSYDVDKSDCGDHASKEFLQKFSGARIMSSIFGSPIGNDGNQSDYAGFEGKRKKSNTLSPSIWSWKWLWDWGSGLTFQEPSSGTKPQVLIDTSSTIPQNVSITTINVMSKFPTCKPIATTTTATTATLYSTTLTTTAMTTTLATSNSSSSPSAGENNLTISFSNTTTTSEINNGLSISLPADSLSSERFSQETTVMNVSTIGPLSISVPTPSFLCIVSLFLSNSPDVSKLAKGETLNSSVGEYSKNIANGKHTLESRTTSKFMLVFNDYTNHTLLPISRTFTNSSHSLLEKTETPSTHLKKFIDSKLASSARSKNKKFSSKKRKKNSSQVKVKNKYSSASRHSGRLKHCLYKSVLNNHLFFNR